MAIRMEDKSQRKSHRISLPAKVMLEGEAYSVLDWSLEGFKAEVPEGGLPDGWTGHATFILPLQHMNISFEADVRLCRQGVESAGFCFESLPTRSKALLSTYIKASIEGQLDDIDGMIARVEASVTPVETEKPLSLSERKLFKRNFFGRAVFYLLIAMVALSVVGFIVYNTFSKARSIRGEVSVGLVDSAPEMPGFLTKVAVDEGEAVSEGQLLYSLDDRDLVREIEDIRHEISIDKEELEYLYVLLKEEAKSMGLYRKAAVHEAERYRAQLAGIEASIEVARKEFERAETLIETGVISRSLWEERRETLLNLRSRRKAVTEQLSLAEENIRSSEDGKYLSDGKTRGEMRELEAKVRIQEKVIQRKQLQLAQSVAELEKTRVLSTVDGTVYAVKRLPGTFLRPGESVLTLLATEATPWVLARFTFEEAERLSPGVQARVYFPALDAACTGVIKALGPHAMASGGVRSLDVKVSQNEVPVKVMLLDPPESLAPGIGAVVTIDTQWFTALKALL